jgi:membrane protein implicated in regulation of membrane protease activity
VIILGLLLIAAAVAAVTGVAVSSTNTAHVEVFGHSAHALQVGVIFTSGAIAGIVFALGCSIVLGSFGRRRVRRREARQAERARLAEQRALRDRNAELERKLETEKAATPTATPTNSPHAVDLTTTENGAEPRYAGQESTR